MTSSATDSATDKEALKQKAMAMAKDGKTITDISKELEISWTEVRGFTSSVLGTKKTLTIRLNKLASEPDKEKRAKLAEEADKYADFLYDAIKHLRHQVDGARRALTR